MKLKWTLEILQAEALKYKTRGDFLKYSPLAYKAAHRKNILDTICANIPSRADRHGENSPAFKWTNEELHRIALKYKTKHEFRKANPAARATATKRGIINTICSHMPKNVSRKGQNNPAFKWTDEDLKNEALKYEYRSVFFFNSSGAYDSARNRGILESICSHMITDTGISRPEKELFQCIKNKYFDTQKLRNRDVEITDKPYIKGFDIDIFIPSLNKGIEFDGKYHHSFEYMRKDKQKTKWSNDDIRNYHEIKDAHFLSIGIQVLHIKEEDWIKDKEACIQRCFDFLGLE